MGVDLFFVLSGFLITGILVDTKKSAAYFKNFYVRRCLRIWPLYYSVLFLMFVVVPLLRPSEAKSVFGAQSSPWWAFPLFIQNCLVRIPTQATGLLGVTWSLAVEEQFYLVWPLVVRLCSEDLLRKISFGAICISPVLRFYLARSGINLYSNTFCRMDGLMAGALLALVIRSDAFVPSRFVGGAWITLFISGSSALLVDRFHARWIVFSFVAMASVSFVYLALFSEQVFLQTALKNRFLAYTGTISFGIYLLEKLPLDAVKALNLEKYPLLAFPITTAMTYALAALSWNILERPFLRLKRFFDRTTAPTNRKTEAIVNAS
jgi:peptidoglycan/LPS O-acetylase OafA/YrhL